MRQLYDATLSPGQVGAALEKRHQLGFSLPICPAPCCIPMVSPYCHLQAIKGIVLRLPDLGCFPRPGPQDQVIEQINGLGHLSNRPHTSAGAKAPKPSAHLAAALNLPRQAPPLSNRPTSPDNSAMDGGRLGPWGQLHILPVPPQAWGMLGFTFWSLALIQQN